MMAAQGEDVYCTLVMNDGYLPGAAVLAHSLRDAGTKKKLAVMIVVDALSADAITELKNLYDIVIPVQRIANPHPGNVFLMGRGDLLYTFTKINLWRQTQFRKIVYVDADIVALRAIDELFDIDAPFAAAPDIGWPDAFNSGLMVISPNMGDFWALQTLASTGQSFDGADQGLLNQYYEHRGWHRLSFTYNCTPNAEYQWEPAYKHYKSNIKMVHFIGKDKPWVKGRHAKVAPGGVYSELVSQWWAVYDRHLKSPVYQYTPSKAYTPSTFAIQKQVFGEAHDEFYGVPPDQRVAPPAITDVAPSLPPPPPPPPQAQPPVQPPQTHVDPIEQAEAKPQEPAPSTQERRFSAPRMEWDATKSAPPAQSKPEASQFPTTQYTFSDDKGLYQPPASYPEPPKDMYYDVPESKHKPESPPPAIFPWERQGDRPKPSRVFANDSPPSQNTSSAETKSSKPASIAVPPVVVVGDETFTPFSPQANAWDENPSIERYVRAVLESQGRNKARIAPRPPVELLSPSGRRESLILTDFPSADDRPSLPVTPAPIRRPTFWGEERDEAGELPGAEGVPGQAEWNPSEKLEELRRSSVLEVQHLKSPESHSRRLSNRDMPAHAAPLPTRSSSDDSASTSQQSTTATDPSYYSGSSTPRGESLQTVVEESSSAESSRVLGGGRDGAVVSPRAQAKAPSVATLEAELSGHATSGGMPMFSEPDFGGAVESYNDGKASTGPETFRRSPGSFSAAALKDSEVLSPTER